MSLQKQGGEPAWAVTISRLSSWWSSQKERLLEALMRQLPGNKSNDHVTEGGVYWQVGPGWIQWGCWFCDLLSQS